MTYSVIVGYLFNSVFFTWAAQAGPDINIRFLPVFATTRIHNTFYGPVIVLGHAKVKKCSRLVKIPRVGVGVANYFNLSDGVKIINTNLHLLRSAQVITSYAKVVRR